MGYFLFQNLVTVLMTYHEDSASLLVDLSTTKMTAYAEPMSKSRIKKLAKIRLAIIFQFFSCRISY